MASTWVGTWMGVKDSVSVLYGYYNKTMTILKHHRATGTQRYSLIVTPIPIMNINWFYDLLILNCICLEGRSLHRKWPRLFSSIIPRVQRKIRGNSEIIPSFWLNQSIRGSWKWPQSNNTSHGWQVVKGSILQRVHECMIIILWNWVLLLCEKWWWDHATFLHMKW